MQFNRDNPKTHLSPDGSRTQKATSGSLSVELDEFTDETVIAFVHNNDSGSEYLTKIVGDEAACVCPDFQYRGVDTDTPCKHLLALFLKIENERQNGE